MEGQDRPGKVLRLVRKLSRSGSRKKYANDSYMQSQPTNADSSSAPWEALEDGSSTAPAVSIIYPSEAESNLGRYTITASKNAPMEAGNAMNSNNSSPRQARIIKSESTKQRVTISHSSKKAHNPGSRSTVPPEAGCSSNIAINERSRTMTLDDTQHAASHNRTATSPVPIPLSTRYPPTSYRDPFEPTEDELLGPAQSRLPAGWKPENIEDSPSSELTSLKFLCSQRLSEPSSSKPEQTSDQSPQSSVGRPIPKEQRHKRAAASIGITPPPQPTPDSKSSATGHNRIRSTSHTSSFAQRARKLEYSGLPPPEEVYSRLAYFTHCSHSTPPTTRPLNVQPVLQPASKDLSGFPSLSIKTHLSLLSRTGSQKPIYTIDGICAECDWRARRDAESDILLDFAHKRYDLSVRLGQLEIREGEEAESSSMTPEQPAPEPSEEQMSLRLSILALESDIEDLESQQDEAVKEIWKGFTRMWGPGTIEVLKQSAANGTDSDRSSRAESSITSGTTYSMYSVDNVNEQGKMRLDWIRPDVKDSSK